MLPVTPNKTGNRIALPKELMDPIIFMAPESAPTCFPPMSEQTVQLGLRVRSTPKVANAKNNKKPPTEGTKAAARTATNERPKPHIAGKGRDRFQCPRR